VRRAEHERLVIPRVMSPRIPRSTSPGGIPRANVAAETEREQICAHANRGVPPSVLSIRDAPLFGIVARSDVGFVRPRPAARIRDRKPFRKVSTVVNNPRPSSGNGYSLREAAVPGPVKRFH